MSVTSEKPTASVFNVPNQLTAGRIVLSVVMFVFLGLEFYAVGLVLFLVAAGTDWLDGYWARKYNQITQLGRILDPFADKLIICGAFIYLAAIPGSRIAAWMAVVIVARELLVTVLRSFLEARGADFSAKMSGKLKMVLQCLAAGLSMLLLALNRLLWEPASAQPSPWLTGTLIVSAWAAVAATVYSGVVYIYAAINIARRLELR